MAKEKHRCAKRIYEGRGGSHDCGFAGVNFEDDKWWCKKHTPSVIAAKDEAQREQWRKERVERDAKLARRARREELRDACVQIVRDISNGNAYAKPHVAAELIREHDALDGKGGAAK